MRFGDRQRWLLSGLALGLVVVSAGAGLAQDLLPPAEQYTVRVEYLWWSPTPAGDIQKGLGNVEGTLLDVRQDLAIEAGGANTIRGAIRVGEGWKIRGGWTPLDFRGEAAASQPFVYGTLVARVGDQIITSIKGDVLSAGLEWDFLQGTGGFLGALFGVKYFDVGPLMLNASTTARVAESWQLPIPVVGLAGRAYFGDWFSFEGELGGMTAGSRGHLFEWIFALRVHPTDFLAVSGGYHRLTLEGRDDRDYFDLGLGAWTFGVEISL